MYWKSGLQEGTQSVAFDNRAVASIMNLMLFFRSKPMSCLGRRINFLICLRLKCPSALFINTYEKYWYSCPETGSMSIVDVVPLQNIFAQACKNVAQTQSFYQNTCQQPCARNVTPQTTISALKFIKWWQMLYFLIYSTEYNVSNKDHKNKMAGTQILSPLNWC